MLAFPRTEPHPFAHGRFILLLLFALALPALTRSLQLIPRQAASAPELARLPLAFIPNTGQLDAAAPFYASGPLGTLFFAQHEVALALPGHRDGAADALVRLRFENASPAAAIVASDRQSGIVNTFAGDDPGRWRTNLPTYAGLVYSRLYAGIDLRYEGIQGALKGTYTVAPGADPSRIGWGYAGAERIRLGANGDLLIQLLGGAELVEQAPIAWQDVDGRRVPVAAQFNLRDTETTPVVGFALGAYDATRPLTIDPYLLYSTFVGGSNLDEGRDVAVDAQGNAYVTGTTFSTNFPHAGPPQPAYGGPASPLSFGDAFVMKLNATGNALVYMTYLGGSLQDIGDAIAVDADGNAYVTGMTESTNFPTKSALQPARGGQTCSNPPCADAFITKLNAAGNALVWSTYLGGDGEENAILLDPGTRTAALGIAVDTTRNVYVAGTTESTNFPTKNAAFTDPDGTFSDAFVAKIQPDGAQLLYSSYLGGSGADYSGDIAVDTQGNAYVTGRTLSSSFPTKNAYQSTAGAGIPDAFVAKFNPALTGPASLVYSTYLGGDDTDAGMGIAVDGTGSAIVAGYTESLDFPTQNAYQSTNGNPADAIPQDAFLSKLGPSGNQLVYSTYLGGNDDDVAYGVDVDTSGNAYVAGVTSSTNFPVRDAWQPGLSDFRDTFVVRIDPTKTGAASLVYGSYLGGSGNDYAYGIAVDPARNAYIAGYTGAVEVDNFPVTTTIGSNGAGSGVLIAKWSPNPTRRIFMPLVKR